MRKLQLYTILKISTARLKKSRYNINLTLKDARINGECINLGESQMIRSIKKLTGHNFDSTRLKILYIERKKYKNKISDNSSIEKLKYIESQIDDMLFVPEIVSIFSDRDNQYSYLGQNGFILNGKRYTRLLCSAGNARRNSALFIEEIWEAPLKKILNNGRNDTPLVPAKYSAYLALAASSSHPVSMPYFCVVKDCEITRKETVEFISENNPDEDDSVETCEMDIPFNFFDGQGLVSPELAEIWAGELEIGYIPSAFLIRGPFLKGLLVVFDFHKFSEEIAGIHVIKDFWGNDTNLRDADVVLTNSQLKLAGAWNSQQEYLSNCIKNDLQWSVSRVAPKREKSHTFLNYQFLQVLNLDQQSIENLCSKTIDYFRGIIKNEYFKSLIYLLGSSLESGSEENIYARSQDVVAKALIRNSKLSGDPFITTHLYRSVNKKIKESYLGNLIVDGFYTTMCADPYAMAEYICGRPVVGLLEKNEHYNKTFLEKGISRVAAMRAPLTWKSEVNILNLRSSPEIDEWYKYSDTLAIYNIHGCDMAIHGGCDWDGDLVCLTNSNEVISGAEKGLPLYYETKVSPKEIIVESELYKHDINAFGSKVGVLTNISTAMYSLLPTFPIDSKEYKTIENRLKQCRLEQGNCIDKAKGILVRPLPQHWTQWKKKSNNLSTEESDAIDFNNSILADKRPYFFRYLYSKFSQLYKNHIEKYNNYCVSHFGKSLDSVLKNPETEEENKIIYKYNRYAPLIDSPSVVNLICHYMESKVQEIKLDMNHRATLENISILKDHDIPIDKDKLKQMYDLFRKFKSERRIFRNIRNKDGVEIYHTVEQYNRMIYHEALNISSNIAELANLACVITYELLPNDTKTFLWSVFPEGVLANIEKNSPDISYVPYIDENGSIEFLGQHYSIREINLSTNLEEEDVFNL